MSLSPRLCVVIAAYNHGRTVREVARRAQAAFPVIVVNDGSTDETAASLAEEPGLTAVLRLPRNRGKGAALRAGFAEAERLGFSHAITLDADGQHPVDALERFGAACLANPEALVIGLRHLKRAGAPRVRRWANALSAFGFRIETGLRLADTQCGYRGYPLEAIRGLGARSERYGFEYEVLVRAAWAGLDVVPVPVEVDYTAPTSKLSHFRPVPDLAQLTWLHLRLAGRALNRRGRLNAGAAGAQGQSARARGRPCAGAPATPR